jgi:hypothetical protein
MRRATLLLALTAAACGQDQTPRLWQHPQNTQALWDRDHYACLRDASIAVPADQQIVSSPGYRSGEFYTPPMVRSFDAATGRREALRDACLRSRGWSLAPVPARR